MNIHEIHNMFFSHKDRASCNLLNSSAKREPNTTQSDDFRPSLFSSNNITFRRTRKISSHHYYPRQSFSQQVNHPDVSFKKLPFYRVLTELVRPSNLLPDNSMLGNVKNIFQFNLTHQQVEDIRNSQLNRSGSSKLDYVIQVQMRFCLKEEKDEQEDCIPSGVTAKVNERNCYIPFYSKQLPGDLKKKKVLMKPINITSLVELTTEKNNEVTIVYPPDFGKKYVVGIFLVRKLTSYELANRIRIQNVQDPEFTRTWIINKFNVDAQSEIATTSLCVSLACPLGKMRMKTPGRAFTCTHLQCFDVKLYLEMNEMRPTWNCPVCNKYAPHDFLVVDGYFKEVLASDKLVEGENEIQLLPDGSWKVLIASDRDQNKKGQDMAGGSAGSSRGNVDGQNLVVDLISSDEEDEEINVLPFKKRRVDFSEKEVIVVDSD